jgi:hypothetical protein
VLIAVCIVTALTLFACMWASGAVITFPRYAAVLFLPMVLLPFAAFSDLPKPAATVAATVWGCIVILGGLATSVDAYRPLAKEGDWVRVARLLQTRDAAGDAVVVRKSNDALALADEYSGPARIVPLPGPLDFSKPFDPRDVRVTDAHALHETLLQAARPNGRFWLTDNDVCFWYKLDFGCSILERELAQHWRVLERHDLFHVSVRLVEAKTPR